MTNETDAKPTTQDTATQTLHRLIGTRDGERWQDILETPSGFRSACQLARAYVRESGWDAVKVLVVSPDVGELAEVYKVTR